MNDNELLFWFDHGLGDCVHFAYLLQLYERRGYKIRMHYEGNKSEIWRSIGVEYVDCPPRAGHYHQWAYAPCFNLPTLEADWTGSKIALNLNSHPLPEIGNRGDLWEELVTLCYDSPLRGYPKTSFTQQVDI